MIDVSELIYDPDFSQEITVQRKIGDWVKGKFVEEQSTLVFTGIICPANAQEINQVPEGDRVTGMMKFHTVDEVFTTKETGTSDVIDWRGKHYRVINVTPYVDYGCFSSLGVYMESA